MMCCKGIPFRLIPNSQGPRLGHSLRGSETLSQPACGRRFQGRCCRPAKSPSAGGIAPAARYALGDCQRWPPFCGPRRFGARRGTGFSQEVMRNLWSIEGHGELTQADRSAQTIMFSPWSTGVIPHEWNRIPDPVCLTPAVRSNDLLGLKHTGNLTRHGHMFFFPPKQAILKC